MLTLPGSCRLDARARRRWGFSSCGLWMIMVLSVLTFDVSAACTSSTGQTFQPPKLTVSGAADLPVGTAIDSAWSQAAAVGLLNGCSPSVLKGTVTPAAAAISGVTYQDGGKTYPVYATGINGVGYAVGIQDGIGTEWLPLATSTQTYPMAGTGTSGTAQIGTRARIRLVATGQLKPGSQPIAAQKVGTFSGFDASGKLVGSYAIDLASTSAELQTSTCTVLNPSLTVALPKVSQQALTGSHASAAATTFSISLRCKKGSRLYMVMTDANNPGQTKNLLFPKGGLEGIAAVKVEREGGKRVAFGPDSSAPGTVNQWLIGDTPDGMLDIPLTASYQTYSPSAAAQFPLGEIEVAATFTLSYQ